MATVLNRTTKQLIVSANTPDYPTAQWIIEPDLSAVAGQPSRYWTITGDTVTLMNQSGRDAVDAAILSASEDITAAQLDGVYNIHRAFALVCLDEFNAHALKINAILDAVDAATSLADLKTRVGLIADYPQRTIAQLKTGLRNKLGS